MILSMTSPIRSLSEHTPRTMVTVAYLGLILGLLVLGLTPRPARAFTAGEVLGTVDMGSDTSLSAAVYDSSGQRVRTLYSASPQGGSVLLTWDGRDDQGNLLPSGNYQWRAITTNAVGQEDGTVGNNGNPPYGASIDPMDPMDMAYDSAGNMYMISSYEEDCCTLRCIDAANITTGVTAWEGYGMAGGTAIATDGTNVYFALWGQGITGNILCYSASSGTPVSGWPNFSASTQNIPGLAVDTNDLWVSDMASNLVKLYNKTTGAFITSYAVTDPRGIATEGNGDAWVACAGVPGSAIELNFNGTAITATGRTIANLQNPFGVAYFTSGGTPYLYVTEVNTGAIDRYNITATPTLSDPWASNYFGVAQPGAVSDTKFYWPYDTGDWLPQLAAIAASPSGQFAVTDLCNHRVMVYDANGNVIKRFQARPTPYPDTDENVGSGNLTVAWMQFQVTMNETDPVYGKPWTLADNWMPTNGEVVSGTSCLRKLSNGNEYIYYLTANNSWTVYQLNTNGAGSGMRQSVIVEETAEDAGPLIVETDTNGDGIVGDNGDTTTQCTGWYEQAVNPWVDTNGNLWFPYAMLNGVSGIAELPLTGFDSLQNPIYNWSNAVIVCPLPAVDQYKGMHARYDPNYNRVFLLTSVPGVLPELVNYAGSAIEVHELTTGRRSLIVDPVVPSGSAAMDTISGLAVDPSGNYFYTGHTPAAYGQFVNMLTWDGLLVASAQPGSWSGYDTGWLDYPNSSLAAVNYNGTYYLYSEDDWTGCCVRYAFSSTDENFVTRSNGNFAWTASPPANLLPAANDQVGWEYSWVQPLSPPNIPANDLAGWWKLDENSGNIAADSSGNGEEGMVANATWLPTGGRLGGALSFNGSNSVVALPDYLLDNGTPVMSFTCWVKTSASGVILGDQDLNYQPQEATAYAYTPMLYIGQDGYLRASISSGSYWYGTPPSAILTSPAVVNDNNWHHLAFVVGMYTATLYVDGVAVASEVTAIGSVLFPPQGGNFCQLGAGIAGTSASNLWPGCSAIGWFYYNGLLDDARLYDRALAPTEVAALAAGVAAPAPTATPTFTPCAGVYSATQTVTISCATSGASIRYTTDGSAPSETHGSVYSSAVNISSTTHLKAIAYQSGQFDSAIATGEYTIGQASSTPGTIQWSNNGVWGAPTSTPATLDVSNLLCNGNPITSFDYYGDTSETIWAYGNAFAFNLTVPSGESVTLNNWSVTDWNSGATIIPTCTLSVDGPPNAAFGTGTFAQGSSGAFQTFTLSVTPSAVTLTPGTYTLTLFMQDLNDGNYSSMGLNQYTINLTINSLAPPTQAPTFAPGGGTTVAISCATSGATINYTTNGTVPSSTVGTVYSSPVAISAPTTLQAIAYETGLASSPVTSATYSTLSGALVSTNSIHWTNDGLWKGPATWPSAWPMMETVSDLLLDGAAFTAYDAEGDTNNNGWNTGHTVTFTQTVPEGQFVTVTGWSVTDWNQSATIKPTCTLAVSGTQDAALGSGSFSQGNSNGTYTNYTLTVTPTPVTLGPGSYTFALTMQDLNCQDSGYMGLNQYTVNLAYGATTTVATPTFTPPPCVAICAQTVSILTDTPGASINYTTDGSTPSQSHGTLYTAPINITGSTTLQAIAYAGGLSTSGVACGNYTIYPGSTVTQINCGGGFATPFITDCDYTGGAPSGVGNPVAVAGVANAAPMSVYQTYRGYACSYTIPNIQPGAACTVRLHFAEPSYTQTGQRQFNVTLNGVPVLTNFDIVAAAGAIHTAVVESFTTIATTNGTVTVALSNGNADIPLICGIEVLVDTNVAVVPVFSPLPAAYSPSVAVTMSSATSGATIRYTTDGSTPSATNGTVYSTPVTLNSSAIVQAIAYAGGMTASSVTSGFYAIDSILPPQTGLVAWYSGLNIPPGTSAMTSWNDSTLNQFTAIGNASYAASVASLNNQPAVYFNGSQTMLTPDMSAFFTNSSSGMLFVLYSPNMSGNPYYAYITQNGAEYDTWDDWSGVAYLNNFLNSSIGRTNAYPGNIPSGTALLEIESSPSGYLTWVSDVAGTGTPPAAQYWLAPSSFTLGGWASTAPDYTGWMAEILLYNSASDIVRQGVETYIRTVYGIGITPCGVPTFSPPAGSYSTAQTVSISTSTGGATLRYTTDGSSPTETAGTIYSTPVVINPVTTTLQAIAYASGYADSNALAVYTYPVCATPSFTPLAGTYAAAPTVTISTTTSGATLHYTTNGITPSSTVGTVYSSPVSISANATLQAIAYAAGYQNSLVASGVYTIQIPCVPPTFTPAAGSYSTAQTVTISTTTGGASIRYTTDGTSPSETAGLLYTGPITISAPSTLKAIAYLNGMVDSTVTSGSYLFGPPTSGLVLWLRADAGVTTTGSSVSAWNDQSGNGYNVTQTTPSLQPSLVYNALGNMPALAFESGDALENTAANLLPPGNARTVYVVGQASPALGTGGAMVTFAHTLDNAAFMFLNVGTVVYVYGSGVTSGGLPPTIFSTVESPFMADFTTAGTGQQVQCAVNGVNQSLGSCAFTAENGTTGLTIGNDDVYTYTTWMGTLAEVLVYNTTLSQSANQQVEGYLRGRYSVLPAACATPDFLPAAGTYATAQTVTISSATSGATIYYTTNGTTPSSTNGTLYSNPVAISSNTTLQAIAYAGGVENSLVTSGAYAIECAAPSFTPAAGTYGSSTTVTISTSTGGASIRYTTNGTTPSSTVGTLYSSPVSLTATTTLQAIAYASSYANSPVTVGVYTLLKCTTPTFTPAAGTYNAATSVTISTSPSGATIRYTTNGTTPSSTVGTVYSSPVSITATATTLEAIAYDSGYLTSNVATGVYTLQCAAPAFSPAAGTLNNTTSVTITTSTSGATIRYTTNGTTPSSTVGTVYSSAVSISATSTLQAIAYETNYANSTVTSGVYTFQCAAPSFTPAAGAYGPAQTVTITTSTSGATIRYTTNGTAPTSTTGTVYSSAVSISATATLEAIAYATNYANSTVTTGVYTINGACAAPTFNPAAGTFTTSTSVSISTTTGGATIRYTTNGTTPSSTVGTVYSSAVSITATSTLEAIAYKTGYSNSTVVSGTYTIQCAAPTFTPAVGTLNNTTSMTITTSTGGATIRYTTNGTTPSSTAGTVYSSPVSITATGTTLEAIAYKSGLSNSAVTSGVYTLQCAAPTFTPAAGTLSNTTSVTITTTTSGATIRYTTNGTTPTSTTGTVYSSAVSITATGTTLEAIAYATNFATSTVTSGVYTLQCAAPSFSPAAGTVNNTLSVTITTSTSGATIRYTTNGTTPSSTVGTVYSSPVSISATGTTLAAIAYATNFVTSSVTSGVYTLQCAAPSFSPAAGTFNNTLSVTITTSTSGATIRYTTNGTTPSSTVGTVYSSPVSISATATTLEAIAYASNFATSGVTSGVYTLQCAAPTFSPGAATYDSTQTVTIATSTSGASIRYTTNGTTPSSTVGTVYSSPVSITATSTLQAIAYKTSFANSSVASAVFTIDSLPAGMLLWLNAEAITGVNNGGSLATWNDSSGNGYNATALTSSGMVAPTYVTNVYNGMPVVRFGGNSILEVGSLPLGPYTIATVFKSSGTQQIVYEHSDGLMNNADANFLFTSTQSTISVKRAGVQTGKDLLGAGASTWAANCSTPLLTVDEFGGTDASEALSINGAPQQLVENWTGNLNTTTVYAQPFNIGGREIGPGLWLSGDIAEIVIYSSALSGSNLTPAHQRLDGQVCAGYPAHGESHRAVQQLHLQRAGLHHPHRQRHRQLRQHQQSRVLRRQHAARHGDHLALYLHLEQRRRRGQRRLLAHR